MQINYKAGTLRAELIRLQAALVKSITITQAVMEDAPKRRGFFGFGKAKADAAETTFNIIGEDMKTKLEAMIEMCDHAFDDGVPIVVTDADFKFLRQLRKLEEVVRSGAPFSIVEMD